jgi:2-polyprenyl-3-methyl-5-hydroxy-6-metoxy-1,4-benzoquinol methylase
MPARADFGPEYFRRHRAYGRLQDASGTVASLESWYEGFFRFVFRRWRHLLPDKGAALDVGCGYGACLRLLQNRGFVTWGTDVSAHALSVARASHSHDRLAVSDIRTSRPFPNRRFDLVICFEVLEHLEEPERALNHLESTLQPKGILWITTPNPRFRVPPYDPWRDPTHISVLPVREWQALLRAQGLTPIITTTTLHVPLLHRLGPQLSHILPTGMWGPSLLILAKASRNEVLQS